MKYITHKTLGGIGNLGSQIQQYASLYSVAKATGRTIVFPESSLDYGVDECSGEKLGWKPKHDFVSLLDDMIKYWMEKDLID
jgi:nucleoside-diphosphate-sugar epimerase